MWTALAVSATPVVLRSSSRPAPSVALHLGAEIVGRAGEAGDELDLALDAGIERLRLTDVDLRADVRLALPVVAVEPRRGVAADSLEVGKAEAAARRRAHAAGHRELAAERPIEDRVGRGKLGGVRVDGRIDEAVARRPVEIDRRQRFAPDLAAREPGKAAEILGREEEPAAHPAGSEHACIMRLEMLGDEVERVEGRDAAGRGRAARRNRDLAADGLAEGGVGEREALGLPLRLEQDFRLALGQRGARMHVERRRETLERGLRRVDVSGVEGAVDRRARRWARRSSC